MKKLTFYSIAFLLFALTSCDKESSSNDDNDNTDVLVGQDGNPRFNLVFTNPDNVDLDLYVKAPNGTIIYYGNPSAAGGTLDVDCLCGSCAQGPNENIFWETGSAPSGQYEYWVEYYGSCSGSSPSSNYTIRTIRNGVVLDTKTGSLSSGESQHYIHNQ
jgi:uncharacterized protein YfaP (DUF2135 family)